MSKVKLAGVVRESIVDGPGIRFVVFAQGCPHHCPGCHNPQTWPFEGGNETDTSKVAFEMKKNPLLSGVTLSGGEPFCQPRPMAEIARDVHTMGLNVMTYTGYTYERLVELGEKDGAVRELLGQTDILVDGRFVSGLKSYDLNFRGSSNQRIIDVIRTQKEHRIVEADIG